MRKVLRFLMIGTRVKKHQPCFTDDITNSYLYLNFIIILSSCRKSDTNETGFKNGEIEQPQIMYNQQIYCYYATGFDDTLPQNYSKVGEVKAVDNRQKPDEDFKACRLEVGQAVYANTGQDIIDTVYVQYSEGYAKFNLN